MLWAGSMSPRLRKMLVMELIHAVHSNRSVIFSQRQVGAVTFAARHCAGGSSPRLFPGWLSGERAESIAATVIAGSTKTSPHCENGVLAVIAMLFSLVSFRL